MEKLKKEIQIAVNIFKSGNLLKAEAICKKLITNNPKVAFIYNLLGLIYERQKKLALAIKTYEKGIDVDPNFAMIYSNLGLLYFNENSKKFRSIKNIKKAEELYRKAIFIDAKIAEAHNNLGTLYSSISRYEEAEKCFNNAVKVNPNFPFAFYNLGTLLITIGKFKEAKENLKKTITLNPNFILAHRALSRISKYKENDNHLLQLKKLYKSKDIKNANEQIELCFALGKANEDIENYEDSFNFYFKANEINRKKINYSINDDKTYFKKIKNTFNNNLFRKFEKSGSEDNSAIFIVGMPRSGTTLVEQIISSHPIVFGADEVETIPFLINKYFNINNKDFIFSELEKYEQSKFKKIGEEYVKKMNDFSRNAKKTTDKLPINFLSIGLIKLILPNSKIIHCKRDAGDNILSIFKNNFTSNKVSYAYDLSEIVEYYNIYSEIMDHWNKIIPNFIHTIKYEELVENTNKETKNLLKFCNLSWSDDCLKFYNNKRPIKTASDVQVRNKIYKTSVSSWKKYDAQLSKFLSKLKVT
jgi:tetratricopeptide (TPR) repeat protein